MNVKGGGRIPAPPPGASALVKVAVLGGAAVYAATQSLYNVEGGHRAIVFNRIQGIKDKVWTPRPTRSLAGPPFFSLSAFDVRWSVGSVGLRVRLGEKCGCRRCVDMDCVLDDAPSNISLDL